MSKMKIEVRPTRTETKTRFYWHLMGHNGETICSSQLYTRKWSAKRTANKLGKTLGCPVVEV